MIYLDNAATTGRKPDTVLHAMAEAARELSVNAGRGSYTSARKAVQLMDDCREELLALSGIRSGWKVYFSPSATVSFNQIILGLELDAYSSVYVTPFEHNAVMRPLHAVCGRTGAALRTLPFRREDWSFDSAEAESMFLSAKPDYVFFSMVSNTTGYVLPAEEITRLAHASGAKVIVDCAQAFGAVDVNLQHINADAYVFAGHKTLYGPYGASGMILKDSFFIRPGLYGGTGSDSLNLDMPTAISGGYEPGSANVPAICGLLAAVRWIRSVGVSAIQTHDRQLIDSFAVEATSIEKMQLFLPPLECRSGIVAFTMDSYEPRDVGDILDAEFGICVRTGYQCAPLVHDWLNTRESGGVVRLSVSYFNTAEDIGELLKALRTL